MLPSQTARSSFAQKRQFRSVSLIHCQLNPFSISQFAPDVVEQLSERQASPTPTPERQSTLDEHIRARIQNEVKQLRKAEEQVQEEIRLALEKENLDKEKAMAGEASGEAEAGAGSIKSSAVLLGDLEEIQAKIDRFQTRKSLANYPELKASQDALISCYKCVSLVQHPCSVLISSIGLI